VCSKFGKIIGLINSRALLEPNEAQPLQNFALASDALVVLGLQNIWALNLAETVVSCPLQG